MAKKNKSESSEDDFMEFLGKVTADIAARVSEGLKLTEEHDMRVYTDVSSIEVCCIDQTVKDKHGNIINFDRKYFIQKETGELVQLIEAK